MRKLTICCLACVTLGGCTLTKTENPLSPAVAGPLPGVNITAPNPLDPRDGARIMVDQQPVTLTLTNATSNGVRPVSYLFEVAADAGFASKIESLGNVPAGTSGRTSYRMTQPLGAGRTYYWRAKAQDGANESVFSANASFQIVNPVSFQPPIPTSPVNGATVTTVRPVLSWNDAPRTGTPNGTVVYDVEVSDTIGFSAPIGTSVNETPGATTVGSPADGRAGAMSFWRVRAKDVTTVGPWSAIGSFVYTPPAAAPPASGGGGSTGSDLTSWWNPADPQGSWMRLVQGRTPDSATLVSLGPYLVAIGGRLENPNAAGITSKIHLPNGKIVRVGENFDSGPGFVKSWTWVPQN
jgi:hypothetical protein